MKKAIFGFLAALAVGAMVQTPVLAQEYNPFDNMYKANARQETVAGQTQFVYVLQDVQGQPLTNATLEYFDYAGVLHSAAADADGKVRVTFTSGTPFVQLRGVIVNGKFLQAIGDDISADADIKDMKKGEVEYFVLQQDAGRSIVHVYDAD